MRGDQDLTGDRIWMVELIVCVILVLFFLFYFNRLFATLVSYGIRAYTWHTFRVYIDIQALQISFLAGRIFFKGIRYHGENETIFVQHGYITWTYWLRSARQVDLARQLDREPSPSKTNAGEDADQSEDLSAEEPDKESGRLKKVDDSESRIAVSVTGLEWFIYNRTPVYDAIIETTQSDAQLGDGPRGNVQQPMVPDGKTPVLRARLLKFRHKHGQKESDRSSLGGSEEPPSQSVHDHISDFAEKTAPGTRGRSGTTSTVAPSGQVAAGLELSSSLILRFLPVYIECQKGAISLGNENTRAILVTTFAKAKGHVDAGGAGALDYFRQLFDFDVEHPVIQMRPNPDFRQSQQTMAERTLSSPGFVSPKKNWWSVNLHLESRRRKVWHGLRNLVPRFRSSVESFHASPTEVKRGHYEKNWQTGAFEAGDWRGLSRYFDDEERDDHEDWAHVDYARFSTIVDCPGLHLTFYWDVPGKVTDGDFDSPGAAENHDINGSEPPAYGIDLLIRGGHH